MRTKMQISVGGMIVTTSLSFSYDEQKGCYYEKNLNREFSVKQVLALIKKLDEAGLEDEVHSISIMVQSFEHPMWVYII
jgi:hypothetical protein